MNLLRLISLKIKAVIVLSAALMLGACSTDKSIPQEEEPEWIPQKFQVNLQKINASDENPAITSLNAYVFVNNTLQKIFKSLAEEQAGTYSLYATSGSTIYFLANASETSGLQSVKEGVTDLASFLELRSRTITANTAPELFFSGSCSITTSTDPNTALKVPLVRNQAQLDLDTSRDENIKVTRIVINGASAASTLFSGDVPSSTTEKIVYDLPYDPAISSQTNIWQLYESNTPLTISVYANYKDIPTVVNLSLPEVKRNFKYTIELKGVGTNITGSLQIVPWQDGGIIDADPDQSKKINIETAYSTLPEGIVIDETQNAVTVSDKGGTMTLAFSADIKVELGSAEGLGNNVTITPQETESKDGKIVSKFLVNVLPQGKGRLGYLVTLHMKRASQEFSYDEFYIHVEKSVHQIAEVTLGGVTWMAFNATTPNLDDQIYLLDGETVEDAYKNRWGDVIGGLFQWGRLYMYTPWKSGSNDAGKQKQDIPWVSATHVPCPEGYRVPTKQEMRALLPAGKTIPGEYEYNGEKVAIRLFSSTPEAVNIGGVSGKARYMKIENDKGAALYIPLSGQKGDKSGTNNPGFGQGFTIWTNDNKNAIGGWAWTGNFWPGINNSEGQIPADSQLQAEGYAYLRCVKKENPVR